MTVREWKGDRRQLLDLLLLADEQESMLDRYLSRGTLFVLEEGGLIRGEALVTDEGSGVLEIKNIAVRREDQGRGYGRALIGFLAERYAGQYQTLQVGTGDSPATLPFYLSCGFLEHHRLKDFFTENYDHPIFDGGVLLRDMVILRRDLRPRAADPVTETDETKEEKT